MSHDCAKKLLQRRQVLIVGAATCASACLGVSCGTASPSDDAGVSSDAGLSDAGVVRDAGLATDAGSTRDAGVDAGTPDAGTVDSGTAADAGPGDAGVDAGAPSDAGQVDAGPLCPGRRVGQASTFALDSAVEFNTFFVVRDAGGLYALSKFCTHSNCAVVQSGENFDCNCHGSRFTLNGAVVFGPASVALEHYAVCVDGLGNVSVDTSVVVGDADRA